MKSALRQVALDAPYTLDSGHLFITGAQALVRLCLAQQWQDEALGFNTAGFISGYGGFPLEGLDHTLQEAAPHLQKRRIHFQASINEDLAATAVWGSQQAALSPHATVQGAFSLWYGRGSGVGRCSGETLKHANLAGTSPHGGVLAVIGDNHGDLALMEAGIPLLYPATIQDILGLGLAGWALSRYAGLWVGLKAPPELMGTVTSVAVDSSRLAIQMPTSFKMPSDGPHLRWPDALLDQERRLYEVKLKAVPHFVRANQLNRSIWPQEKGGKKPRFGIIAVGKSYNHVRKALEDLGIDEGTAKELGLALFKVTVGWPLEPTSIQEFCQSLSAVLVVEEKRPLVEDQVKTILYHLSTTQRPQVLGKTDAKGKPLVPAPLDPTQIAAAIAGCLKPLPGVERFQGLFQEAIDKVSLKEPPQGHALRPSFYCLEKACAPPNNGGIPWVGQAPFTTEIHTFTPLGEDAYHHSGLLAIRAAIAAKVSITYKILLAEGQATDSLTAWDISHQAYAEGVRRIAVVTDEPGRYPLGVSFAPATTIHHRDKLASLQEDLKIWKGVSVLIDDQRDSLPNDSEAALSKHIVINETVCDGCGDCAKTPNRLSIVPLKTEWGLKRAIDPFRRNTDDSGIQGFCPSFVTVTGGRLRKPPTAASPESAFTKLPTPKSAPLDRPYCIFITGAGEMGAAAIGPLLGMAAHLEGKSCSVIDVRGSTRKSGVVAAHIRLSKTPEGVPTVPLGPGEADLLIGGDLAAAASLESLKKISAGKTKAVADTYARFTQEGSVTFSGEDMKASLTKAAGEDRVDFVEARALATALMGTPKATNLFLLGYALQKGYIPLSLKAMVEAIRLTSVETVTDTQAFQWGRLAAANLAAAQKFAQKASPIEADHVLSRSVAEQIQRRYDFLANYQDKEYADRYLSLVKSVAKEEERLNLTGLTEAASQSYYQLLAVKDAYEIGRLYTNGDFMRRLKQQFDGDLKLQFHLVPLLFGRRNRQTGEVAKVTYGPWAFKLLQLLAKGKRWRGSFFDIFRYTAERRLERKMVADFETMVGKLLPILTWRNHSVACELLALPQSVRGFGHIKKRNLKAAREAEKVLWKKMG